MCDKLLSCPSIPKQQGMLATWKADCAMPWYPAAAQPCCLALLPSVMTA